MDPVVNRSAARFIPIAKPSLGAREAEAVARAVGSGWISSGPLVEKFESEFAEAHGKKFGVACNSGTTALHLALVAAGVNRGHPGCNISPAEEATTVCLPAMTMIACANAALYCGGRLRLVDSEALTGNMDFRELPCGAFTKHSSKFNGVILCPHLYGVPATDIKQCKPEQVVEDCAEAHYATYPDGSPVGSHGSLAVFSFYANKIIVAGEGGMVLTDSPEVAEKLRGLRSHAFTPGDHFTHQSLAFGYRMTEMQAAIGLIQHSRRREFLEKREALYERYCRNLASTTWLTWPRRPVGSVTWMFPISIVPETWRSNGFHVPPSANPKYAIRDSIRAHLAEAGIETRTYFRPLDQQPHLAGHFHGSTSLPVAQSLYQNGACLPIYFDMEFDDVDYICERLIACGRRPTGSVANDGVVADAAPATNETGGEAAAVGECV